MKQNQAANELDSIIKIKKFQVDHADTFHLTHETDWVNDLLQELEEGLDEDDLRNLKESSELEVDVTLKRMVNSTYRDHLSIDAEVQGHYHTPCVRCLIPTRQEFSLEFSACFLSDTFLQDPQYEEQTDIFVDGKEMQLYFHSKGEIDLKELVHEQIYLVVNPNPLHDEECKGLCSECGTNLNRLRCKHHRKF